MVKPANEEERTTEGQLLFTKAKLCFLKQRVATRSLQAWFKKQYLDFHSKQGNLPYYFMAANSFG